MKKVNYIEIVLLFFLSVLLFFSSIHTLPVLDRDEARYAQASRQMIEQNDFINIKFQEEYRSKKPIGIYWIQTTFVQLFSSIKKDDAKVYNILKDNIWKYRFTSSLGGLISILIIYFLTQNLFGRKTAFYSALILASGLLFIIESHIAKTDAFLLTVSILVMALLAGYYTGYYTKKKDFRFFLLWFAVSISILIKGPVLPLIMLMTIIALVILNRDYNWLKNTQPFLGLIIIISINIPWFLLMPAEQFNNFFYEGIKQDFFGKLVKAQESHNAFFGAHFLSLWVLFFPMSFFLIPLFYSLKKSYKNKKVTFLLAWILPSFFVFELVPTKLPHYTLPLYPAISILMGHLISEKKENYFFNYISYIGFLLYFIAGLAIVVFLTLGVLKFGIFNNYFLSLSIILSILILLGILLVFKTEIVVVFYYKVILACILSLSMFYIYLPNMEKLWVSKKIVNTIILNDKNYKSEKVAALGYNEPSLVFEVGTNISIFKNLYNFSKNIKKYNYFIIEKLYYNKVVEILLNNNVKYELLNEFEGFNSAKGKNIIVSILKIY